jgi:hypothetical protein
LFFFFVEAFGHPSHRARFSLGEAALDADVLQSTGREVHEHQPPPSLSSRILGEGEAQLGVRDFGVGKQVRRRTLLSGRRGEVRSRRHARLAADPFPGVLRGPVAASGLPLLLH